MEVAEEKSETRGGTVSSRPACCPTIMPLRFQTDEESFEQVSVSVETYFPQSRAAYGEIGRRKWFLEDDSGAAIQMLRIKDNARGERYENTWNESGTHFIHRVPTSGREYRLLKRQATMSMDKRTPFRVIRCIGSSAWDLGSYAVYALTEDGYFDVRRVVSVEKSAPPPKKKRRRTYPQSAPTETREPVKSSSEGRHLNLLRQIFGGEGFQVHYEPCSFKVQGVRGHWFAYTPDFLVSGKDHRVAIVESKYDMSGVDAAAIAKASGVEKLGMAVFFMVGAPCDLMVWRVCGPCIRPSSLDELVDSVGGVSDEECSDERGGDMATVK